MGGWLIKRRTCLYATRRSQTCGNCEYTQLHIYRTVIAFGFAASGDSMIRLSYSTVKKQIPFEWVGSYDVYFHWFNVDWRITLCRGWDYEMPDCALRIDIRTGTKPDRRINRTPGKRQSRLWGWGWSCKVIRRDLVKTFSFYHLYISSGSWYPRPYVERANKSSFRYSRLVKSAVIFVDPAHPLPRTPKGSISRATALKHYAGEIDKMYEALEKGYDSESLDGIKTPESWADLTLVETWVKRCVTSVLGWEVDVAGDFFQQGMDR